MMRDGDWLRRLLITEPRGYPCQNVDVVFPPTEACPEALFSYVIGENNFVYPAFSGHNTICVATALLEAGHVPMVEPETRFVLEAPAGPIEITASVSGGRCESVTMRNAPAFARPEDMDLSIDVPTVGPVAVDVAWGGMWYAIVHAADLGLEIAPECASELAKLGEMVKVATREQHPVSHPTLDYPGCDIVCIRGAASEAGRAAGAHAANAVVMSTGDLDWSKPATWRGNIDRSPCGSGTSAVMAALHARGELELGEHFVHEGILGALFTGRLLGEAEVAPGLFGVVPEITGSAWITQCSAVAVDPTDPVPDGYTLGDLW